jgi:hypothetical protein
MARKSGPAESSKKGISGILLGVLGCGVLALCLFCSAGGGLGWFLYSRVSEAVVATKPIGKFAIADLDNETAFLGFAMRLPKGMVMTENEKDHGGPDETSTCMFAHGGRLGTPNIMVNKSKFRPDKATGATTPLAIMIAQSPPFQSAPGGAVKYDTPHNPQAIEMNGIAGARTWKLIEHRPDHFETKLHYRYHIDGWVVIFIGSATGKSRDEAVKNAGPVDAAMCTFKKR